MADKRKKVMTQGEAEKLRVPEEKEGQGVEKAVPEILL